MNDRHGGSAEAVFNERVVSLANVRKLAAGTRCLHVPAAAVVTPSALEHLRDAGIELRRAAAPSAGGGPAAATLLVAAAEVSAAADGLAAGVVRGVPSGERLPSVGLAAAIASLAEAAARNGSRGLLLSSRPASAAVLANRHRSLRAVIAADVAGGLAAAAECRATLLVADPQRFSGASLRRLAVEFAKQSHAALPDDLAEASRPCGCRGGSTSAEADR